MELALRSVYGDVNNGLSIDHRNFGNDQGFFGNIVMPANFRRGLLLDGIDHVHPVYNLPESYNFV